MSRGSYVLITPARNEEHYIGKVIDAVISQSLRPAYWVVVNDGSEDRTGEIVADISARYPWIKLINNNSNERRSFGSKAKAFRVGYRAVSNESFEFVGNLDADVTFPEDYYERMIKEMRKNPRLGVVSGVVWQREKSGFRRTVSSLNHAVGAVQFWRKSCFEEIGGYQQVTVGGMDALAELTARMKGWKTRSLPDVPVYHLKPIDGALSQKPLLVSFRAGMTEYHIGTLPLMAVLKALRRWRESPPILGSIVRIMGYMQLWYKGVNRDAPSELVAFVRNEQKNRLKNALKGNFDWR